tara:strand:+ start:153 stop:473 length:321 start_codon:yes stop_codon:yes gene_type:complete
MSVKSNVKNAESAIRKALINALAEGEDQHLTELFEMLMALRDLKKQVNDTIRFTDNTEQYYNRASEFNLDLDLSEVDTNVIQFPTRHGSDLDSLDDFEINTDDEEG